ncbi:LysR family transcriptional regulator [Curvibacter sp. HBC28]|uniref:LysR family transcriptional regulator n=1 Tax=Curvibacter microcysteis TaxID=3026419 RepID=A0ABT5MJ65_9BURK|nr:LysR family transcriptional regulator [Curvibacter sp. HBC28]MDD0815176.1 LysR family transcriptional regulator [Curvibacter sp. HBC28]
METRHLEAFSAVMSSGSITGAARLLDRSQPAVTRLIQELEAEIGHPLFQRHGPRVTPTEHGFGLRDDVERALASLRQVGERARQISQPSVPSLELVATSALALGLLPPALAALESTLGHGPLQLRSSSPEQVVQAVLSGAADLGLSSLPLEHRGLQVHWIGQLPCVAVLRADDPLASLSVLPVSALAERRLITMSNPYRLRHRLESALPPGRPESLIQTNSSVNAQALVRAGLGLAVLEPLTPLGLQSQDLVTRPLDTDVPFFFGVITLQARPRNPALEQRVQTLAQALLAHARSLPGFEEHPPSAHTHLLDAAHGLASEPPPTSL